MKIRLVVATLETEAGFFIQKATGQALSHNNIDAFEIRVFAENQRGLPTVYNEAIREARGEDIVLVFAHDDLFILDYFWVNRILDGLQQFDLIGLAGNRCRVAGQPAWAFVDMSLNWADRESLSGIVGQGMSFRPDAVLNFGPSRQQVKLLDGALMAVRSKTLSDNNLCFDERFDFHHYDLDFCRQAEEKGLTAGTWDLSVVHQSYGDFRSQQWRNSSARYFEKWGE